MKNWIRACLLVTTVLLTARVASGQSYAEFIVRSTLAPEMRKVAEEAVTYSLASMARLGALLWPLPKIYFVAATADCMELHLDMGDSRSTGEWRCARFSGTTWPGAFVANVENVVKRNPDPVEAMWWLMPHELWHLYQHQTGMYRVRMPWALVEGTADLHKFKVLHERRIIDFPAYTMRTTLPRAKRARERASQFSIQVVGLDALPPDLSQEEVNDRYRVAAALGVYLHNEAGGWAKVMALHAPGATSFNARFQELYGKPLSEFEAEFWAWLARQ